MEDLTAFQRDILYTVASLGDPHGLAVKSELEEYYDSSVNHGRLYPNLDALIDLGLISKGQKDRRTNEYQVTQRAIREIEARRRWERLKLEDIDIQV